MKHQRQCERKGINEEDRARREVKWNQRRERRTQVAVAVEIERRRETSIMSVNRDEKNDVLRKRYSEGEAEVRGLETSHYTTTDSLDNTLHSPNENPTTKLQLPARYIHGALQGVKEDWCKYTVHIGVICL